MTRVLILGAGGMLGHKVLQRLSFRFEAIGTTRSGSDDKLREIANAEVVSGVDITDFDTVRRTLTRVRPQFVINCVGIIKQLPEADDALTSIRINSLFPHELTLACRYAGARVVHLSTDCVFSGRRGRYTESDVPDPVDLYGRSKLLGEVDASNAITLRTSIIGRELRGFHSLVEWFLRQPVGTTVRGYTRAVFSGLTNIALADEIGRLIEFFPDLTGVYHLSADPITKHDLLTRIRTAFAHDVTLAPDDVLACDRSLVSDRYAEASGYRRPSWDRMIEALASDRPAYDRFHPNLSRADNARS